MNKINNRSKLKHFLVSFGFSLIAITNIFNNELIASIADGNANLVIGQINYTSQTNNFVDANGLYYPFSVAIDTNNLRVYVADRANNRVLWWNNLNSLVNGKSADGVLGQPDFYSFLANENGGNIPSANTLDNPWDIAVDGVGNVWVADTYNNRVLRFSTPIVSGMSANFVLGQRSFNTREYQGVSAQTLYNPRGVRVDSQGNIWVADSSRNRVLKYNLLVSTYNAVLVLGQSNFSSDSSGTSSNTLRGPYGVDVDNDGNVWVADSSNNRVLKYSTPIVTGMNASIVLGQPGFTQSSPNRGGSVASNSLYYPTGVDVDNNGNVWISDTLNNRVVKYNTPISATGEFADLVLGQKNMSSNSSNQSSNVAADTLSNPRNVFVDDNGHVWVSDGSNNRVLKYNSPSINGESATLVLGKNNFNSNHINSVNGQIILSPYDVAVDTVNNRIYVSDTGNNRILWWNSIEGLVNGKVADGVLGQADFNSGTANRGGNVAAANTLYLPTGLAVDGSGNLWVCDRYNNRVLRYNFPLVSGMDASLVLGQSDFLSNTKNRGFSCPTSQTLYYPYDISLDQEGNIFVADSGNSRVLKYDKSVTNGDPAIKVLGQADFMSNLVNRGGTPNAGTLFNPYGVEIDRLGRILVSDTGNNRVLIFSSSIVNGMDASFVLGQVDFFGNDQNLGCGIPSSYSLNKPYSVLVDKNNYIWISDTYNNRVLRFTALINQKLNADIVIGQENFQTNSINLGSNESNRGFNFPIGLVSDTQYNLWVVDNQNYRVLKFNAIYVSSINPSFATNVSSSNLIEIIGQGFVSGITIKLTKSTDVINATNVNFVNPSYLTCFLNLSDKTTGYWNIVISTGAISYVLENRFLIKHGTIKSKNVDSSSFNSLVFQTDLGKITLEISTQTFSENVVLTVSLCDAIASNRPFIKTSNICFEITNDKNLQPLKDINLIVEYNEDEVKNFDKSKLSIARYISNSVGWMPIESNVDVIKNRISCKINHLSKFAVVQLSTCSDLETVKVYPNPYNPLRSSKGMTFEGLTSDAKVKVFTISGELVSELSEKNSDGFLWWDGKNKSGNIVASGVYIALIESKVGKKSIKIIIEK